jgi:hypothetical protein
MYQEQDSNIWTSEQIERELNKTSFPEHIKDTILNRWYQLDESEELEAIEKVLIQEQITQNYADPVANGNGYGQKDILRKLKQMGL